MPKLRLLSSLLVATILASPASPAAATDDPAASPAILTEGVMTEPLIETHVDRFDLPFVTEAVVLARWTFAPGAEIQTWEGQTHLVAVESGALTAQLMLRVYPLPEDNGTPVPMHLELPEGPPTNLDPGDTFVATGHLIANSGNESAEALVISFLQRRASLAADNGITVEPLAELPHELRREDLSVSLVRHTYDRQVVLPVAVPLDSTGLLVVETGLLNIQASGPATHVTATPVPSTSVDLIPTQRANLWTGDSLITGPGVIATRNVAREPTTTLVLTLSTLTNVNNSR